MSELELTAEERELALAFPDEEPNIVDGDDPDVEILDGAEEVK